MANNDLTRPHVFQPAGEHSLLLLHGTGADEYDLLRLGKALNPSASLLSPRGMYLEAGMNRFFERYPDGSFNEESVIEAVDELAGFLDHAVAEYGINLERLTAVGFSNGANTAAAMLVRKPHYLKNAVLFGSTRPFASIAIEPELSSKRVWIANGDHDPYAPNDVTEGWVSQLRNFGAEVNWLRHPGGHQISPAHLQEIASQLI